MNDFVYKALSDASSTIRLLLLHPSTDLSSSVHCSLIEASLHDCERDILNQYTALSYVWGDTHSLTTIYVNSFPFQVTHNLFHALRDLRDALRFSRLWVDAICINQSDNLERSQQVSLMGNIYSLAQLTVIYLGEGTTESRAVFKSFRDSSLIDDQISVSSVMRSILERPWFDRAWVFQELVLSRDPWVQLGRLQMRWGKFFQQTQEPSLSALTVSNPPTTVPSRITNNTMIVPSIVPIRRIKQMHDARQSHQSSFFSTGNTRVTLEEILQQRRGCGVSDPRDMVFAHHGFVDPRTNIPVDYSKSLSWVFATATRKIIHSSASLEILCHVVNSDPSRRPMDLPSWVPDYASSESNPSLFSWVNDTTTRGVFKGREVDCAHPMFSVSDVEGCESLLVVDGFELDTIVDISPVIQWEEGISEMESEFFLKSNFSNQAFDRHWNAYKRTYEAWRAKKGFGFLLPLPTELDRRILASAMHSRERAHESLKTDLSTPSMLVHHSAKDKMSSVLSGRRVARFKRYGMGIVPATAEVGDILCNLEGTAWILRSFPDASEDLDMRLGQTFVPYLLKKDIGRKEPSSETFSPSLPHVSFIGECLIDAFFYKFYHNQANDYLKDYKVARDGTKKIFIIH